MYADSIGGFCMIRLYHEQSGKLTGEHIREYIYGGKGIVTLLSPTGVHHTYMFARPRNQDVFPDDVVFVYAVHDKQKLFYVGMIESGRFRITRNSRFDWHTDIVKGANYIVRMANDPSMNTPMILYHEGMCACCGRQLTNPKSIESGIGPKCRKIFYAR